MSGSPKSELKTQIDDLSLQVLLLAKLISDEADRKDQLDQVVRVLDLLTAASERVSSMENLNNG